MNPLALGRSGRPRGIVCSDLFLWDPELEIDLTGQSIGSVLAGHSRLLVSAVRDARRGKHVSRKRAELCMQSIDSSEFPLIGAYRAQLLGTRSGLEGQGQWCRFFRCLEEGPGGVSRARTPYAQHILTIEEALTAPTAAYIAGEYGRCADLLDAAEPLADYLWPNVGETFRNHATDEQLSLMRILVMLELMLSRIAHDDAVASIRASTQYPVLETLFPNFDQENWPDPNALFFDWLKEYSGAGSALCEYLGIVGDPDKVEGDIDSKRRLLNRWRDGEVSPSIDALDALFSNLYLESASVSPAAARHKREISFRMAMATRRVRLLASIVSLLIAAGCTEIPFCLGSLQRWRVERYRRWFGHWLNHSPPDI